MEAYDALAYVINVPAMKRRNGLIDQAYAL